MTGSTFAFTLEDGTTGMGSIVGAFYASQGLAGLDRLVDGVIGIAARAIDVRDGVAGRA